MSKKKKKKKKAQQKKARQEKKFFEKEEPVNAQAYCEPDIEDSGEVVTVVEYLITNEPVDKYPKIVQNQVERVHNLVFTDPKQAVDELEILIKRYPNIPVFYNLIANAYRFVGNEEKSDFWIHESYKKHPNYVFAKLNLASLYLEKKQVGKVEEIFANKLELRLLYPERDVFHITEVVTFYSVIGHYYLLKKMRKQAKMYYKMAKEIYPDHPSTLHLKRKLHPFLYWWPFHVILVLILTPLKWIFSIIKYTLVFVLVIVILPFHVVFSLFKLVLGKSK